MVACYRARQFSMCAATSETRQIEQKKTPLENKIKQQFGQWRIEVYVSICIRIGLRTVELLLNQ